MSRYVPRRDQTGSPDKLAAPLAVPAEPEAVEPWCTSADVIAIGGDPDTDWTLFIAAASEMLYLLSENRYPGAAQRYERPGAPIPPNEWSDDYYWRLHEWIGAWGQAWCYEANSEIVLNHIVAVDPDSPMVVKIDGVEQDPDTYWLVDGHYLRRLIPYRWPWRQLLDAPDTERGTFSISYVGGRQPPEAGKLAAAALAMEVERASTGTGQCALPLGVTSIVRAGITFTLADVKDMKSGIGLPAVDTFLGVYGGDTATVWSPDLPQPSRLIGG